MRLTPVVSIVLAGFSLACGRPATVVPPPPPPETNLEAQRAIEAAMQRYAGFLKSGAVDSTIAMFAPDGELLEPGLAELKGRNAIRAFLTPIVSTVTVESAATTTEEIVVAGAIATQWGDYRQQVVQPGKGSVRYQGHYAAEWEHESDGQWHLKRLLMQPGPPPPP
jgi:uncharacterized protein (TIGR02246 family)